jgi:hypothetical protein
MNASDVFARSGFTRSHVIAMPVVSTAVVRVGARCDLCRTQLDSGISRPATLSLHPAAMALLFTAGDLFRIDRTYRDQHITDSAGAATVGTCDHHN